MNESNPSRLSITKGSRYMIDGVEHECVMKDERYAAFVPIKRAVMLFDQAKIYALPIMIGNTPIESVERY